MEYCGSFFICTVQRLSNSMFFLSTSVARWPAQRPQWSLSPVAPPLLLFQPCSALFIMEDGKTNRPLLRTSDKGRCSRNGVATRCEDDLPIQRPKRRTVRRLYLLSVFLFHGKRHYFPHSVSPATTRREDTVSIVHSLSQTGNFILKEQN